VSPIPKKKNTQGVVAVIEKGGLALQRRAFVRVYFLKVVRVYSHLEAVLVEGAARVDALGHVLECLRLKGGGVGGIT